MSENDSTPDHIAPAVGPPQAEHPQRCHRLVVEDNVSNFVLVARLLGFYGDSL
jgi:hypothetical protein